MKRVIAMLFVAALSAFAGDVSGKYTGTISNGDPVMIILKQDGANLTGSGGPGAACHGPAVPDGRGRPEGRSLHQYDARLHSP